MDEFENCGPKDVFEVTMRLSIPSGYGHPGDWDWPSLLDMDEDDVDFLRYNYEGTVTYDVEVDGTVTTNFRTDL